MKCSYYLDRPYNPEIGSYFDDLKSLQKDYLDTELKIRALIKEPEWNNIMDKVVEKHDHDKAMKQLEKGVAKIHNELTNTCENVFTDQEVNDKAKVLINEYKAKILALGGLFLKFDYKNQESIRNYTAPREDFETLQTEMLGLKKDYINFVIELRFNLNAIAPESERKNLNKSINKSLSQASKL